MKPKAVILLLAPILVLYLVLFVGPLANGVAMSLHSFTRREGLVEDYSLANYIDFITDPFLLGVWATTIQLAVEVAILTTIAGYGLAYWLWRSPPRFRGYMTILILSPLLVSSVVRAYGWVTTTGPAGLLPQVLAGLGLEPVSIMYSRLAVEIGLLHVLLPFAVIIVLASLDRINPSVLLASRNLGANSFQTFTRVTLPLSLPGIVGALVLAFALTASSYALPTILGGGRVLVASRLIYQQQTAVGNWPLASAMAITMALVIILVVGTSERVITRGRRSVLFG
jgi:putative spermidine/putrescine transport system permease protein